jgi:hypothetical protein
MKLIKEFKSNNIALEALKIATKFVAVFSMIFKGFGKFTPL